MTTPEITFCDILKNNTTKVIHRLESEIPINKIGRAHV